MKDNMREKLLDNMKKTNYLVVKIEKLNEEYNFYHKGLSSSQAVVTITYVLLLIPMYLIIDFFVKERGLSGIILFVLIIPLFLIPGIIHAIIRDKINNMILNKKKIKYKNRIKEVEELVNNHIKLLEQHSLLPQTYWYSYATKNILEYIKNLRADNLKDAINLYESEMKHLEQMETLRNIQEQQQEILNRVDRATDAANDAELVSWMNLMK